MVELDHNQKPTTSQFTQDISSNIFRSNDEIMRLKRLRRFKRQFSIYVQTDDIDKNDGKDDDQLFKYPGDLRGIKRKRIIVKKPINEKRKTFSHQQSIQQKDDPSDGDEKIEIESGKNENCEAENKATCENSGSLKIDN
ncbi:unnamed protein product [Caenorhabditis angaria]|uniref:Uncharacterized protein n=1 Tax=Caenorhabditis angaria TaxID=860376 RepID=A0A9P1J025_9PELO|nr:unnamed protein product [Caenorhabditis angaria]